ncbi:hypothetical protein [Dokdonella sp.]|uniref:hypothetical protein n=1 Tax=Dokdonella sp. TaxID=2291710 RepID=UPI0035283976
MEPRRAESPREHDSKTARALERRQFGLRLFRRLIAYHLILLGGLLFAVVVLPDVASYLPIGGVSGLVEGGELTVGRVENPVATSATDVATAPQGSDRLGYARQLAIILLGTWLLMLPIAWVHKGIHRGNTHDHSLDETVLILPGIVAAIVLVVQHSLALAFSLAGIVAGVQFRRALQDTFDTLFILVAIGTGIAAGVSALEIAAIMTVFFTYATLYVHYFGDGFESDYLARKKAMKQERKEAEADSSARGDED